MACNVVATYNTFTGDGTTTAYTFTFPYKNTSDVQVKIDNVDVATSTFSISNTYTLTFTSAPANGATIRIYRCTGNTAIDANFQSGSAIRAVDLNDNFTQTLYVTQESNVRAVDAETNAAAAVVTANGAVTTANGAVTTANGAVTTANTAITTANAAQTAVSNAIYYSPYANVSAIPGSPADGDHIEVLDSTGIESFSPLSGVPAGFTGDSGLNVRLKYSSSASSWAWIDYYANDAENRYLKLTGGTLTGALTLSGAPTQNLHPASKVYVDNINTTLTTSVNTNTTNISTNATNIAACLPLAGGTLTGALTLSGAPSNNLHAATKLYVDQRTGNPIHVNPHSITADTVISSTENGLAVGPITVNSGVTITVSNNSSLVIL